MKVQRIELENYKALQGKHEFDLKGCSFFLMAGNGAGKTSVCRLVMDIVTKNLPAQPVTEGSKQGYVEVTLDNGDKIYYRFNDTGKPQLEIITANGGKLSNVSELFKTMAGNGMQFDIDEFLKMSPKPRRAMLEKIAGVDFTEINERERQAEDERKGLNARLKDQRARVVPFDETLLTKEPVNTTQLSEDLTAALTLNQKIDSAALELERLEKENSDLADQLRVIDQKLSEGIDRVENGKKWLATNFKKTESYINSLKDGIANADNTNKAIADAKTAQKEYELTKDLEVKTEAAQKTVTEVRELKDALLNTTKLPAEGLTFSSDGETLLIDGLPFEDTQIATSRKMIAAIQIAESMLGSIKFLHIDASILDKENANKLLTWAENKGLQLALERSLWEGGELKFEIHENNNQTND